MQRQVCNYAKCRSSTGTAFIAGSSVFTLTRKTPGQFAAWRLCVMAEPGVATYNFLCSRDRTLFPVTVKRTGTGTPRSPNRSGVLLAPDCSAILLRGAL